MKKKILILGGTQTQMPLIQRAKDEGYFVILVDFTDSNPGIALCDKHYKINYMDKTSVLEIAKKECVDGCISNSEYAMETVSFICETLCLNGNSLASLENLNDKNKFRKLQKGLGLYAPKSFATDSFEQAESAIKELTFPIVMKPCKSSGSRGTTFIQSDAEFENYTENFSVCKEFSRNKKVVVEEFVPMPSLDSIIDGDVFIYDGKILYGGLFTSKRSKKLPMVPMTQMYPAMLDEKHLNIFKDSLECIIKESGITFGELNVEAYFTKEDQLFFIEINARQGGNGIPEMIAKHTGIDFTKLLVTCAVEQSEYFYTSYEGESCCRFVCRQPLFWTPASAQKSGCYNGVKLEPKIKPYVKSVKELCAHGTVIEPCKNATDCLAFIDLEFNSREEQKYFVDRIEDFIKPEILYGGGYNSIVKFTRPSVLYVGEAA